MLIEKILIYLYDHDGLAQLLGIIIPALILAPYALLLRTARQMGRIRKAYDDLIKEQTDTITGLYRDITSIHSELARTRGELDEKIVELKTQKNNFDNLMNEIENLRVRIKELEQKEFELIKQLSAYENEDSKRTN